MAIFSGWEWDMESRQCKSEELLAWLFNESRWREQVVVNGSRCKDCGHKHGGYLLLDIGPAGGGPIRAIMEERLIQIGERLDVYGAAIDDTEPWRETVQRSEGEIQEVGYGKTYGAKCDIIELTDKATGRRAVIEAFSKSKGNTVCTTTLRWPGSELVISGVEVSSATDVTMGGVAHHFVWNVAGTDITVKVPPPPLTKYRVTARMSLGLLTLSDSGPILAVWTMGF